MTDVFKSYDIDRDGFITLSFEQFLTGKHFQISPWHNLGARSFAVLNNIDDPTRNITSAMISIMNLILGNLLVTGIGVKYEGFLSQVTAD